MHNRTKKCHWISNLLLLSIWVGLLIRLTAISQAGDRCCAHCGCKEPVTKVCRLVKEDKKITTTCWGVQEEEFCIGDPSCPDQEHCEMVCKKNPDDKLDSKVCSQTKPFKWTSFCPGPGATLFTKKKLMKKTVTKTVPSFRWVVEDLCDVCKKSNKEK